jgi:positive regulator of sigma E activity
MTDQGIVKKVEGQLAWISAEQCVGCDHETNCGSCGSRKERLFAARNPQSLAIKTGDRVEYFIAPGKAVKAGFLVLIVPILAFFLFYYLSGILWPVAGETAKVLAGVGGIAMAFVMNFALKNKTREYPEITKVLSPRP